MKKKEEKKSLLSLYLQFIMSFVVIIFIILYFVNKKYVLPLELSLGATLIIMGYNNKVFYKRKNVTILYIIIGVVLVVFSILQFLGVR